MALLLLHIFKERSPESVLELLGLLDLSDVDQARLLITALLGQELAIDDEVVRAWQVPLMACALLHPKLELGEALGQRKVLKEAGLDIVINMLSAVDGIQEWAVLEKAQGEETLLQDCSAKWTELGPERRLFFLLALLVQSRWGLKEDEGDWILIVDSQLERAIVAYLKRYGAESLLWTREDKNLPMPSDAALTMDALLPAKGVLWRQVLAGFPLDAWVLQGEGVDEGYDWLYSQPSLSLSLYAEDLLPPRTQLSLNFCQILLSGELLKGKRLVGFRRSLSQSLSLSLSWAWAWASPSLSMTWASSQSLSRSQSRLLSRSRSLLWSRSLPLSLSLSQDNALDPDLRSLLSSASETIKRVNYNHEALPPIALALENFGYHYAARDWFNEQAVDHGLMERRGLRPGEPLPKAFGLFDEDGRPLDVQEKSGWLALKDWLKDDETILDYVFPEGLQPSDRKVLLDDLAMLRKQPWSLEAAVEAVLGDWPEGKKTWDINFAKAQADLRAACETFLHEVEPDKNQP